jgi:hypothetical protein
VRIGNCRKSVLLEAFKNALKTIEQELEAVEMVRGFRRHLGGDPIPKGNYVLFHDFGDRMTGAGSWEIQKFAEAVSVEVQRGGCGFGHL